jgi:hypothetical protein
MQKESLRHRGWLPIPTTALRRGHLSGHWQLESAWILEGVDYSTHQQTSTIERKQTRRNSPPSYDRTINGNTKRRKRADNTRKDNPVMA